MNKLMILTILTIVTLGQVLFADELPVKQQDVSPEQLQKQNIQIASLAAKQLSKDLPQVINKYTTIVSVKAVDTTLTYTYEINTGAKSDETVKSEDRTNWEKIYVKNVCERSKRFLDAQVALSYVYISAKTQAKLFQFDVTQAKCFKRFGFQE